MSETKQEIPAAMLDAATAAVADHACHARWNDREEARMFRNQAEAALKAAGVLELLAERKKLVTALSDILNFAGRVAPDATWWNTWDEQHETVYWRAKTAIDEAL